MIGKLFAGLITLFARAITAVRADWGTHLPDQRPRVYFANHASHGDFVLVWTVLPPARCGTGRGPSPAPTTG